MKVTYAKNICSFSLMVKAGMNMRKLVGMCMLKNLLIHAVDCHKYINVILCGCFWVTIFHNLYLRVIRIKPSCEFLGRCPSKSE